MCMFLNYFMTFSFLTIIFRYLASKICCLLCLICFPIIIFHLASFISSHLLWEEILLTTPLQTQSQLMYLSLIRYEGFTPQ